MNEQCKSSAFYSEKYCRDCAAVVQGLFQCGGTVAQQGNYLYTTAAQSLRRSYAEIVQR